MVFDQDLVPARVVVAVAKPEKAHVYVQTMKALGLDVVILQSVYEVVQYLQQNLVHLVLAEVQLSDGTIFDVAAKIAQDDTLKKTILVGLRVQKNISALSENLENGVVVSDVPAVTREVLVRLLQEWRKAFQFLSPFAVRPTDIAKGASEKLTLLIDGVVMGKSRGQVLIRSPIKVDVDSVLTCLPKMKQYSAVSLAMGTYTQLDDKFVYDLFPIRKAQGTGVRWLHQLPEMHFGGQTTADRKILCCALPYAEEWAGILRAYDFDLKMVNGYEEAVKILASSSKEYGVVWLGDDFEGAGSEKLRAQLLAIPEMSRPNVIILAKSPKQSEYRHIRYLMTPFGLGCLLDTLEAAMARSSSLVQANANGNADGAAIQLEFQVAGNLLRIDEMGGIILSSLAIMPGSTVRFKGAVLNGAFEPNWVAVITATKVVPESRHYQMRFEIRQTGKSPRKLYEGIIAKISELKAG